MARDRRRYVSRRRRLTDRYARATQRLGLKPGAVRGAAPARSIRALLASDDVPSALETQAAISPTTTAFVRRIAGHNVWLWYRTTDAEIILLSLTSEPPVPFD